MHSCPSPDTLSDLLAGTLADDAVSPVRVHVDGCPACQAALDALSNDSDLRRWIRIGPAPMSEPALAQVLQTLGAGLPETGQPAGWDLASLGVVDGCLGPYRIRGELGRGGMGVVLLTFDKSLRRLVAVKILRPDRIGPRDRARFLREARAAAHVRHDNVVGVHLVAEPDGGSPYLVMEYVEGESLRGRLDRRGRLEPRKAAEIVARAADGLTAIHAAGLLHRDVKPGNILLGVDDAVVKVADLGLARSLDRDATGLTEADQLVGTPSSISPEQIRPRTRSMPGLTSMA